VCVCVCVCVFVCVCVCVCVCREECIYILAEGCDKYLVVERLWAFHTLLDHDQG